VSDYVVRLIGALGERLLDLFDDPARRLSLAQAGRQAAQPFAWSAIADAHLEVYRTVLEAQ
jgi:glycosyltransferase involved in cell wall biosynthesis